MKTFSKQQAELNTITERTVSLTLSTADVDRLAEKAATVGLSISQLLEHYIGDLVDGTYTNGSDERMYANRYFDRCGFEYMTRKSFLRYLSNNGTVDYVLGLWDDYQIEKDILEDDAEDISLEDRSEAQKYMDEALQELNALFSEYSAWAGPEATSLETEMAELLAWKRDVDRLKEGNVPCAVESMQMSCAVADALEPGAEVGSHSCEWEP